MTLPRNIDPPAISPEEESRLDLEQRSAADDLLLSDFDFIFKETNALNLEYIIFTIYHSSGNDELLGVNDLKSLLFNTALKMVKGDK